MPNKCETCRNDLPLSNGRFSDGKCMNEAVRDASSIHYRGFVKINAAREICDREGDGHFVYFEPKSPEAGATFGQTAMAMVASSGCFKNSL